MSEQSTPVEESTMKDIQPTPNIEVEDLTQSPVDVAPTEEHKKKKTKKSKKSKAQEPSTPNKQNAHLSTPVEVPADVATYIFGGIEMYDLRGLHFTVNATFSDMFHKKNPEFVPPLIDEKKPVGKWVIANSKTVYSNGKDSSLKVHIVASGMEYIRQGIGIVCHICKSGVNPRVICSNDGCNKLICVSCNDRFEFTTREEMIYQGDTYKCCHCKHICPETASCGGRGSKASTPKKIFRATSPRREKSKKRKRAEASSDEDEDDTEDEGLWESDERIDRYTGFSKFSISGKSKKLVHKQSALAFAQFLFTCMDQNKQGVPLPEPGNDRTFVDMFGNPVEEVPVLSKGYVPDPRGVVQEKKQVIDVEKEDDEAQKEESYRRTIKYETLFGEYKSTPIVFI